MVPPRRSRCSVSVSCRSPYSPKPHAAPYRIASNVPPGCTPTRQRLFSGHGPRKIASANGIVEKLRLRDVAPNGAASIITELMPSDMLFRQPPRLRAPSRRRRAPPCGTAVPSSLAVVSPSARDGPQSMKDHGAGVHALARGRTPAPTDDASRLRTARANQIQTCCVDHRDPHFTEGTQPASHREVTCDSESGTTTSPKEHDFGCRRSRRNALMSSSLVKHVPIDRKISKDTAQCRASRQTT